MGRGQARALLNVPRGWPRRKQRMAGGHGGFHLQDNVAKIAGSEAFAKCLQMTIDNYVRFANEYTKNLYGIVAQGQEFVSRQVEEGNRRFAQVADISGRAAQAANESVKSAGEEALERGRPGRPRAS
jgi:hypothetical protein